MRSHEFVIDECPILVTEGPRDWGLPDMPLSQLKNLNKTAVIKKPTPKQEKAIQQYTKSSRGLNSALHAYHKDKIKIDKDYVRHIKELESMVSKNKLIKGINVYTGLKQNPEEAWKEYKQDPTKPIRFHLPAFTSTTPSFEIATSFARRYGSTTSPIRHLLLIPLRKGMNAAVLGKYSAYEGSEYEVLLPRGLEILVDPKPTVFQEHGYTTYLVWKAKVTGNQPIQIK